jgi:hypothetical protein
VGGRGLRFRVSLRAALATGFFVAFRFSFGSYSGITKSSLPGCKRAGNKPVKSVSFATLPMLCPLPLQRGFSILATGNYIVNCQ